MLTERAGGLTTLKAQARGSPQSAGRAAGIFDNFSLTKGGTIAFFVLFPDFNRGIKWLPFSEKLQIAFGFRGSHPLMIQVWRKIVFKMSRQIDSESIGRDRFPYFPVRPVHWIRHRGAVHMDSGQFENAVPKIALAHT